MLFHCWETAVPQFLSLIPSPRTGRLLLAVLTLRSHTLPFSLQIAAAADGKGEGRVRRRTRQDIFAGSARVNSKLRCESDSWDRASDERK